MRTVLLSVFLTALSTSAQDLPAGPGKDVFEKVCTQCHGLDIITGLKHTKAEWKAVVDTMAGYGASAKDEEFDVIIDYLAKNFGKDGKSNIGARPAIGVARPREPGSGR
jgi:mono/diheme cytochrome c family protein